MRNLAQLFFCVSVIFMALHSSQVYADGRLVLKAVDRDTGDPTACRIHLQNSAGKPVKIPGAIQFADHAVFADSITLKLPLGEYQFTMERGPETLIRTGKFTINQFADDEKVVDMKQYTNMASDGWYAGDFDIHRPIGDVPLLMQAEGLQFAAVTTWNNEKTYWTKEKIPAKSFQEHSNHRFIEVTTGEDSRNGSTLRFSRFATPFGLADKRATWPLLANSAATARQNQGWVDTPRPFSRELPLWIAAGKLDSIEVMNRHFLRDGMLDTEAGGRARDKNQYRAPYGNGKWSLDIYYNLLECGFRPPLVAGSGSGVNNNPLGYNRVYAYVDGELTLEKWWDSIQAGRTVITNGPLLRCSIEGKKPGSIFRDDAGKPLELLPEMILNTRDKIDYLEVVRNGRAEYEVRLDKFKRDGGQLPPLRIEQSSWFVIRAVTNEAKTFRYAMSAPFFVEFNYKQRISKKAVQFFLDWVIDELKPLEKTDEQLTEEQTKTRDLWLHARKFWEARLKMANAD